MLGLSLAFQALFVAFAPPCDTRIAHPRNERNRAANASGHSGRDGCSACHWRSRLCSLLSHRLATRESHTLATSETEPRTQVSGHSGRDGCSACHWRSRLCSLLSHRLATRESHTLATSETEPRTRVSGHDATASPRCLSHSPAIRVEVHCHRWTLLLDDIVHRGIDVPWVPKVPSAAMTGPAPPLPTI